MQMLGQSLAQAPEGGFFHGGFKQQIRFFRLDARKATTFGQQFELQQLQQAGHRRWNGAVAVGPGGRQLHQGLLAAAGGGGAIGGHFFVVFTDPIGRDEGRHLQIDLGVIHRRDVLTLQFGQAFLQHLHVEIEADGLHLAALLHPQQVAHPPDLHIPHRQLITAAELGEFLNRPQPLPRRFTQGGLAGKEQPGMGLDAAAADAAAQLIQLGQAEFLGVLHQNRIDPGYVQAALNDGGAEHQVGFAGIEGDHGAFQFPFGHLAVGHQQPQARHHLAQLGRHLFDALHPRYHVEDLAAPVELLADRTADGLLILGGQVGLDRTAQGRRRGDQAHLPHPRKAHVKRPRDWRGTQGEHVDVFAQGFDLFLLVDAETLLFIDHQQSQLLEAGALAQQLVGADDDINGAIGQPFADGLAFGGGAKAVEQGHLEGIGGKAFAEGAPVLLGQHRGGGQQSPLLAGGDCLEQGPDRHLRFAKADIAADEPVHRRRFLHVPLHLADGLGLVGGWFVGEGIL